MDDAARLRAIRERVEKATKGPWHAADRGIGYEVHAGGAPERESFTCRAITNDGEKDTMRHHGDADFIAHAREDVPWLLAALTAELQRAEAEHTRSAMLAAGWKATNERIVALEHEGTDTRDRLLSVVADLGPHAGDALVENARETLAAMWRRWSALLDGRPT